MMLLSVSQHFFIFLFCASRLSTSWSHSFRLFLNCVQLGLDTNTNYTVLNFRYMYFLQCWLLAQYSQLASHGIVECKVYEKLTFERALLFRVKALRQKCWPTLAFSMKTCTVKALVWVAFLICLNLNYLEDASLILNSVTAIDLSLVNPLG